MKGYYDVEGSYISESEALWAEIRESFDGMIYMLAYFPAIYLRFVRYKIIEWLTGVYIYVDERTGELRQL